MLSILQEKASETVLSQYIGLYIRHSTSQSESQPVMVQPQEGIIPLEHYTCLQAVSITLVIAISNRL